LTLIEARIVIINPGPIPAPQRTRIVIQYCFASHLVTTCKCNRLARISRASAAPPKAPVRHPQLHQKLAARAQKCLTIKILNSL
jgi:hypothetical protein